MDLLSKIIDFLLKKNWIVVIISFILGTVTITFFPACMYDKIPFSNREVSIVIVFSAVGLTIYLLLEALITLCRKAKSKIEEIGSEKEQQAAFQKETQQENAKIIEETKSYIDSLSDYDYNIIMSFIDNDNKNTLVFKGYVNSDILRQHKEWFYISKTQEPLNINIPKRSGIMPIPQYEDVLSVKLKKDVYEIFKYIMSATGSLSHFPKKRFKVGEESDE